MPVPPMDVIEAMGKELIAAHDMSEPVCDRILRGYIDKALGPWEQRPVFKTNVEILIPRLKLPTCP